MVTKLLALMLLALTSPLVLAFALAVQWASPGPMLLRQRRVGRHGTVFGMWKLRTMVPDAAERLDALLSADAQARAQWAAYGWLRDDPRVAGRAARRARQLSIDELPQLLNVLAGDMALVGPRPVLPAQAALMAPSARRARESVHPGMTGLWQVCGRSDMTLRQMVRLDQLYVGQRSVALDVHILARTPRAVWSRRGAY